MSQQLSFEWGLIPLPFNPHIPRATVGTGHFFAIANNCRHTGEAWQLVTWLTGRKGHEALKARGLLPGNIRAFPVYQNYWEGRKGEWNTPTGRNYITEATVYAKPPSMTRTALSTAEVGPLLKENVLRLLNQQISPTELAFQLQRQLEAMQKSK